MVAASDLAYHVYRAGAGLARALPDPLAQVLGRSAVVPASAAMRIRRLMVARHLRRVRPSLRGLALTRAVQQAFDSYARYWVESLRLPEYRPADLQRGMEVEGLEHLNRARDAGTGAIVVLPHLGGWDFGGAYLASLGFKITVVAERVEPPELFDWFVGLRRAVGLNVVPLGPEAGNATLGALRRGEVVGLVADRDIGGTGVEVEFFGERTTLPGGPATLGLRTGAPIIPIGLYFGPWPRHRAIVHPPIPFERAGRLRDDVTRLTQQITHELESLIRVAPEQWHLFQPNWPSDHELLRRLGLDGPE